MGRRGLRVVSRAVRFCVCFLCAILCLGGENAFARVLQSERKREPERISKRSSDRERKGQGEGGQRERTTRGGERKSLWIAESGPFFPLPLDTLQPADLEGNNKREDRPLRVKRSASLQIKTSIMCKRMKFLRGLCDRLRFLRRQQERVPEVTSDSVLIRDQNLTIASHTL